VNSASTKSLLNVLDLFNAVMGLFCGSISLVRATLLSHSVAAKQCAEIDAVRRYAAHLASFRVNPVTCVLLCVLFVCMIFLNCMEVCCASCVLSSESCYTCFVLCVLFVCMIFSKCRCAAHLASLLFNLVICVLFVCMIFLNCI